MDLETFGQNHWLRSIWQPSSNDSIIVVRSLEELFERIYQSPYEDWCVEDHRHASNLAQEHAGRIKSVGEQAYLAAWEVYPDGEFCALFSDDVVTIASLIVMDGGGLRQFTEERMRWYVAGRFPCGYEGSFPNGLWAIA